VQYAVGHSDRTAGYVATRRLIEIGRRRIGIMCGILDVTTNARDRLNGFRRAMQEAGLPVPDQRVAEVAHSVEAGLEGLAVLMARRPRIDGLVVAGEIWSAAVLLQLLKSGVAVPGALAVAGVGEVELGPYLPVPLTSVALPRYETGVQAAELALALARGDAPASPLVKLPVNLVLRASA
jgi:DNA-binding LacI/PurR family transcriptional regulator